MIGPSPSLPADPPPSAESPSPVAPSPSADPPLRVDRPPAVDHPVLELAGVRKSFGRTEIIRGVDLSVRHGERLALIGPNGAGKSTLFHLISGKLLPGAGSIRLGGAELAGLPPYRINRLGLARSFQITHLFARLTVAETLACAALHPLGLGYGFLRRLSARADVADTVGQMLAQIGLEARRQVPVARLSYAEQRALEIGVTLVGGAGVILLDEPTAGMSRAESEQAMDLIRRLTEGRTLVMVEHDMSVVFGLAHRIAVLVQGQVIAIDSPDRVRADARVQEAYLGLHREAR